MNPCPPHEQLRDILEGLRPHDAEFVAHLSGCASCRGALGALAPLFEAGGVPLPEPPAELIARATAIPDAWRRPAERGSQRWSIATLLRSALTDPVAAGVRGATATDRRLYEADGAQIDLAVEAVESVPWTACVTGQVLAATEGPLEDLVAALWANDRQVASVAADEAGVCPGVEVGPVDLVGVEPYPVSTETIALEDYVITLVVTGTEE